MKLPCSWTTVLLACVCAAVGAGAISAYKKKYEILSAIIKQDNLWRQIFQESVYYKLDRTYYARIIEKELLRGATVMSSDTDEPNPAAKGDVVENDRDQIVPHQFIRNILIKRFVIGSILDMGLEVLQVSFKCLMYKHMVHFLTLIIVEIKRKQSQGKAGSWSGKSKELVESILMTMGTLQFTDEHLLVVLSFFDIYTVNKNMLQDSKSQYAKKLSDISDVMMEYVHQNCVKNPKSEAEVAKDLGVHVVSDLYNTGGSFKINNEEFKKMVVSIRKQIQSVFGNKPRINGMSKTTWYDILHYRENLQPKL